MEPIKMIIPGETISLATQFAFGNNGDKWREDERRWDRENSVRVARKVRDYTGRGVALFGLELWWARIHIRGKKEWGRYLVDVFGKLNYSAASRFKSFVVKTGLITDHPTAKEILNAMKGVNSDVAMLQKIDMTAFWGMARSKPMVTTDHPENREIAGFGAGAMIKTLRQKWPEYNYEEKKNIVETLFMYEDLIEGYFNVISDDPQMEQVIKEQRIFRSLNTISTEIAE